MAQHVRARLQLEACDGGATLDHPSKPSGKKARKGMRGWPMATIVFYGPDLSQATKVAVGIMPSENAEVKELRDWKVDRGDIRTEGAKVQPEPLPAIVQLLALFGIR
jgi:hypothetical protein